MPSTVEPAIYMDRILRGDRAGDLPIERHRQFVLTLNLNTARRMELIIPSRWRTR